MISVNLSIDQLIETVQSLSDAEKDQLRKVLDDNEPSLSDEQKQLILQRKKAYEAGEMQAYSLDELKVMLNYNEE